MKARTAALVFVLVVVPNAASAAHPRVVFRAPTHTPRVNARWLWSVLVTTRAGKPLTGTVSAAVVDPIGGVHPVEYGCCKKKFITNVRFRGRFADYVQFPLSSKGFRLTFRVTVKTTLGRRVVRYWVQAR
jgi:hypothetical protein